MARTRASSGQKPKQIKKTKVDKVGGRTKTQRDARRANEARNLADVNGVISASKVAPGERPQQRDWVEDSTTIYRCSICDMKFKRKYHVQSHMPACVKRNGNPNGAQWDDAWTNRVQVNNNNNNNDHEDVEATANSQESESKNQAEERDLLDLPPSTPLRDHSIPANSPMSLSSSPSSPSSSSSPSSPSLPFAPVFSFASNSHQNEEQARRPGLQAHGNRAVGRFGAYDPVMPVHHLTNEALVGMSYHLDYLRYHQRLGHGDTGPHPLLERVMQELAVRGIAREQRSWTLDLEGVDMGFRRV